MTFAHLSKSAPFNFTSEVSTGLSLVLSVYCLFIMYKIMTIYFTVAEGNLLNYETGK